MGIKIYFHFKKLLFHWFKQYLQCQTSVTPQHLFRDI
jgi:hypothetical protein